LFVGNQVDRFAEQGFKSAGKAEKSLRNATLVAAEVDNEINVALMWIEFASGGRSKEFEADHTILVTQARDFLLAFSDQWMHPDLLSNVAMPALCIDPSIEAPNA
jgi:hypothetical protein